MGREATVIHNVRMPTTWWVDLVAVWHHPSCIIEHRMRVTPLDLCYVGFWEVVQAHMLTEMEYPPLDDVEWYCIPVK